MRKIVSARDQVAMLSPWQPIDNRALSYQRLGSNEPLSRPSEDGDEVSLSKKAIGEERRLTVHRGSDKVGQLSWYAPNNELATMWPREGHIADFMRETAEGINPHLDIDAKHDHPLDDESWYGGFHHRQIGREAAIRLAAKEPYPSQWPGDPNNPNERGRHRPPAIPIRFEKSGKQVDAYHAGEDPVEINGKTIAPGEHLGYYDWSNYSHGPTIGVARLKPNGQGLGVGGAILDHIRDNYEPDLKHSDTLSYQGRAATLRDPGTTQDEWNKAYNTRPFNYSESRPWGTSSPTAEQQARHDLLRQKYREEEDANLHNRHVENDPHSGGYSGDHYDDDEDKEHHEYGYDAYGEYIGDPEYASGSGYDSNGNEHPFGYNDDGEYVGPHGGFNNEGLDKNNTDPYGYRANTEGRPRGYQGVEEIADSIHGVGDSPKDLGAHPETHELLENGIENHYEVPVYRVVDRTDGLSGNEARVGNNDRVYSSIEAAREKAQHPDDPAKDKQIMRSWVMPEALARNPRTPGNINQWTYNGVHGEHPTSVEAFPLRDPQMEGRMASRLGPGWSPMEGRGGETYERTSPDGVTSRLKRNGDGWTGAVQSTSPTQPPRTTNHWHSSLDDMLTTLDQAEGHHRTARELGDGNWKYMGKNVFHGEGEDNRVGDRVLKVEQRPDGTWEGQHGPPGMLPGRAHPNAQTQGGFSTPHEAAQWVHDRHNEFQAVNDPTNWEGNWNRISPNSGAYEYTHPNGRAIVHRSHDGTATGWIEHPDQPSRTTLNESFDSPQEAAAGMSRRLESDPLMVQGPPDHTKWEGNWQPPAPGSNHYTQDHPNGRGVVRPRPTTGGAWGWVENPDGSVASVDAGDHRSPAEAAAAVNRVLESDPFDMEQRRDIHNLLKPNPWGIGKQTQQASRMASLESIICEAMRR